MTAKEPTTPESIAARADKRRREAVVDDLARRAGALSALEPTDAQPKEVLPTISPEEILPLLEVIIDEKKYVQIRDLLYTLYEERHVDAARFDPIIAALTMLVEQGKVIKAGHGHYVATERFEQDTDQINPGKVIEVISRRDGMRISDIYWHLYSHAPSRGNSTEFLNLVIFLRKQCASRSDCRAKTDTQRY